MKRTWKSVLAIVLAISLLAAPVIAEDNTALLLGKIEGLITIIQTYYYKDVKVSDLLNGAIKGMFSALDKHSTYFTPEEYAKFNTDINGEFSGLGMYIEEKNDYIQVISPIKGTPADKGGVLPGDLIKYVDGKEIKGYSTEQASAMMRGQAGTKVRIGISRAGVADIIYFDLVREVIKISSVEYEIMPDNIGYVAITQFNGNVMSELKKAINEFKAKNVKGVIIDVRNNPGGRLDEVVEVCKVLIPKGPIVSVKTKSNPLETHSSELEKAPFKIAMLVNEGSASASEIMAAAVQDSGTGKLVGVKTYGKGTVQSVLQLTDGSGLKITIANYLTPKGLIIDGIGIKPDFEIQNTAADLSKEFAPIDGQRSIKMKTVGLDVLGVQQRLKSLGYQVSSLDGVFGRGTLTAVQKFQKDNKLKVDGSIDADDIKVLNTKFNTLVGSKDAQLDKAIEVIKDMIK
jgi:carboxyl-terminal processing protease